jgi:hypothetical protein
MVSTLPLHAESHACALCVVAVRRLMMLDRTNKDLDPVPRRERKWGVGSAFSSAVGVDMAMADADRFHRVLGV